MLTCVPMFPKVAICYTPDCFSQLGLDIWRDGGHQADELLLDCHNLIRWEPIVATFILRGSQSSCKCLCKEHE